MKKNIFLYSALALGMTGMFASCSSDDVVEVSGGNTGTDATAQVIEIAVDNANSLSTRSGRPLTSEEPDQTIENVAVVITSADAETKDKIVYVDVIDNWATDEVSDEYGNNSNTGANGRSKKITIKKNGDNYRLAAGSNYNVYAIGYSDDTEYTTDGTTTLKAYFSGLKDNYADTKFKENFAIKNNDGKPEAEEIFAGSTSIAVPEEKATFVETVYLHRQVAGIYTNVMEIPYVEVDGVNVANYLRVVASDNNDNLVLGHFWTGEQDVNELPGNGNNTGKNANYVVNGYRTASSATSTVLYTIDLKKWFKELKDDNNDGAIDADENWIKTADRQIYNEEGLSFTVGSAFGGEFLIPFLANGDNQTLKLELVYAESETAAQTAGQGKTGATWNIKLPEAYKHAICAWNTDKWNESKVAEENSTTAYSILRNHLYGVGERPENDPGNGEGDPDPDKPGNPDKPQPLKNTQDVILKVNDNWEVIHHMVIE